MQQLRNLKEVFAMQDKIFQYFHDDVIITGKHSRYLDELWEQNQIQKSFVKTLYELYALAAIIGLRIKSSKPADNSDGKRTIQTKQLLGYVSVLNTVMTMVLLLDDTSNLIDEERIDRAFRGPNSKGEFDTNVELFNSYVRGGIEFLYNSLIIRTLEIDDEFTDARIGNIVALLNNPLVPEI